MQPHHMLRKNVVLGGAGEVGMVSEDQNFSKQHNDYILLFLEIYQF